jgi:very-short-patch-repair endonuclease
MASPELRLWGLLRRSPGVVGFLRQQPVGPYVADFDCPAELVIEIDGLTHDLTAERDSARGEYIRSLRLSVLRIPAGDVMKDALSIGDGSAVCPSTAKLR